jgi:hypothetical protein
MSNFGRNWDNGSIISNATYIVRIMAFVVVVGLGEITCSKGDIAITSLVPQLVPIS